MKISTPLLFTGLFSLAFQLAEAQQTSTTFSYTGSLQTFVVPACVTTIDVDAYGASGGNSFTGAMGGTGGRVQCTLPVTPGETLQIMVGGAGANGDNATGQNAGGFNGGGHGWDDTDPWGGGGGGGASDIRKTPYGIGDRFVIAGGGGGGGIDGCNSANLLTGGAGGGLIGGNGAPSPSSCVGSGQGGTQSAGGAKGQYTSCSNFSFDGSLGQGGDGYGDCSNSDDGGSGGGGGYYGGGGGNFGAGGGGSSYTDAGCTNVIHTQGGQTGNGQVILTYSPCTNVEELFSASDLQVFPNPVKDVITVKTGIIKETTIQVLNLLGEKVITVTAHSNLTQISLGNLPAGVYLISVTTANKVVTKKIVKE